MFRQVIYPAKDKPQRCCKTFFECSQYRYHVREWKRNEANRKMLSRKPGSHWLILFRFSILCMAVNVAFAGLCMMHADAEMAFKCCCGALMWAVCIFIFDRHEKHNGD
jgi:hypothetical protein